MKILFVHDHPFERKENNEVYSGGGLPQKVWTNYLNYVTQVNVYARLSKHTIKNGVQSSLEKQNKVNFFLTEYYNSAFSFIRNFKKIKNEIRKMVDDNDVVIARLPSNFGYVAASVAKKKNKVLLVEQVGNAKEALQTKGGVISFVFSYIGDFLNKKYTKKADFVIYVTDSKLQKDYPTNGVSTSISNVIIEKLQYTSSQNDRFINNKKIKIGVIGGFDVRYKGQQTLLKAISILPEDVKKRVEIYLVGKGNYDWLVEIAKDLGLHDNLKFVGPKKSGNEVFSILKELTIYVQPSYTEGLPRALIEAMSVGCPVLGSNVGGIPDIINNEFIHKAKDYKTLSNQIIHLIESPDKLKIMSDSNLKKADRYLLSNLNKKRDFIFSEVKKKISSRT